MLSFRLPSTATDCHLSRIPLRLYSYSTYESKVVGSILCNYLDIYYFLEQTPTDHTLVTLQAAQRAQARAPKKNDANNSIIRHPVLAGWVQVEFDTPFWREGVSS
jgi:hypothetical protein